MLSAEYFPTFRMVFLSTYSGSNSLLGLLDPEDGGSTIYRNIWKYSPKHTTLHNWRYVSLAKPLWEPQMSRFPWWFIIRNSMKMPVQWPRGLRCRSAAAHLLRLWVRIPPRAWMSVCRDCCVLSGSLCDKLITRPEESYQRWRVVVCDLEF